MVIPYLLQFTNKFDDYEILPYHFHLVALIIYTCWRITLCLLRRKGTFCGSFVGSGKDLIECGSYRFDYLF